MQGYNIVNEIIRKLEKHDVLYDYETYEETPIIDRYYEKDYIKTIIKRDYLTGYLVNMAIMYVNTGLLYAKSKLSEEAFNDYIMYFALDIDDDIDEIKEDGFIIPEVYFSRKGKEHLKLHYEMEPVDVSTIKIYQYVKDVIGLSDFYCYNYYNDAAGCEVFEFVPKFLVHRYKK